ncbi:VRR-NUC domain-containing protein [Actinotignum urinale]|uniref:VRR-NUC domain-containing protein n=1 Tax=Actinotignum urinale TaxID=190146 RepID=UPI00040D9F32|nr:VRR-NUC domain-containing protein [Actinotignum urinale]MDY5159663.1 VRR-NUC domain-containing protein [Actinotignum urinale]
MEEKRIEQALTKTVKARGGWCLKFVSPSMNGMPDRLCLFPDGKAGFVEVKAPGRKPTPLQQTRHKQLRTLGFRVFVLDDMSQIGGVVNALSGT